MKILILIFSIISLNAGAVLLPNPKFEYDDMNGKKITEIEKRRAAAAQFFGDYYDAYVKEFKRLNNFDSDPFNASMRQNMVDTALNGTEEFLKVPPMVAFRSLRAFFHELLLAPVVSGDGVNTDYSVFKFKSNELGARADALENEISLLSFKNSAPIKFLKTLAPSENQNYANIIVFQLFLILLIVAYKRKKAK